MAALGDAAVAAGNLAIPLVKALTAEVAKTDPDAARYVHWGATSQDMIDTALVLELRAAIDALLADLDRAITASPPCGKASAHADRGAHLAAARAADAVRPEDRGLCGGPVALARAPAAARKRGAGAAIRRRGRHARRARRSRARRHGSARRRARPAGARRALAQPSRPARRGRVGLCDPLRHLRQDRARCRAADADRGRRGVRAGGGRPRRLLHDAAQAQSDRGRGRARRRAIAPISPPPSSPRRCRSTSAPPAPGRPNGRPSPRSRSSPPARSTRWSISRRARDRRRAHARQSRRHARADHGGGGRLRLAAKLGKPDAHEVLEEASRKAVAEKRRWRRCWARTSASPRSSPPARLRACSSPWAISARRKPSSSGSSPRPRPDASPGAPRRLSPRRRRFPSRPLRRLLPLRRLHRSLQRSPPLLRCPRGRGPDARAEAAKDS